MSDFVREVRYIVVRLSDLDEEQYAALNDVLVTELIIEREAVVVESTSPIYEDVWSMIEEQYNAD